MTTVAPTAATTRRGLIVHDSLAFLALLGTSVALFGVTLFLFRSFEDHRAELAKRWSERGRAALAANRPEQAVADLRAALSYDAAAPAARGDQLMLAQALAATPAHLDEATNYFLNLRDATPGDGFINLQLARLARRKGDFAEADDDYRASIYGSWDMDGAVRRREVRLELAGFLIDRHQFAEARNELFTIAGNSPSDANLNMTVAKNLESAGFLEDALGFYRKAAAAAPHAWQPLAAAGRAAYALGKYPEAERLLDRALAEKPVNSERPRLEALANDARRIQQLNLTRDQPAAERAEHLLAASTIAQARLKSCMATANTPSLNALGAQWTAAQPARASRRALLQNAATQDIWTQLIYTTEQKTAQTCGQPTGDDALLLRLANAAQPPAPSPGPPQPPAEPDRPSFVRRLLGTAKEEGVAASKTKEPAKDGK